MRKVDMLKVNDELYEVIKSFKPEYFVTDGGNRMNQKLIGMWVAYLGCDRVLRRDNEILIVKQIENAIVLDETQV
jgi:hypothetical protein|tara:strand:+ start:128 stop:352 length:225 start_codon:yes stop_codon:yes gene_type:complete